MYSEEEVQALRKERDELRGELIDILERKIERLRREIEIARITSPAPTWITPLYIGDIVIPSTPIPYDYVITSHFKE